MSTAKAKLESAISKLVAFQPLYGEVFLHLNKKERKNDEIATNLAYDLLKQEQEAEERQKIWWKNLRQLKN